MATNLDDALKTYQFRKFAGMNQRDARTALEDELGGRGPTEFFWLEQMIPIGEGNIRVIPAKGATLATIAAGIATMWGFVFNLSGVETPVLICINNDGSGTQVNANTGATVSLGGANTFTTAARLAMWKDTPILIVDPTKGYFSWDGTTLTTIDATKKATDIAVFEGRAWLVTGTRTITFTSPNTFNDFTGANGAGSVTISDSAFPGNIVRLLSALEQLWIVGPGAVDAISNVQTAGSPLVTTFSITNIVSNAGTFLPSSVTSFFRTFLFLAHYGVYAIVGATPQKLSDKVDNLIGQITFGTDAPAAVFSIFDEFCWGVMVTFSDPVGGRGMVTMVLTFSQGKWFLINPGVTLTWITSIPAQSNNNDLILWGTDGTHIFQVFNQADATTSVSYRLMTKLFDFQSGTTWHEWIRVGLDFGSPQPVTVTLIGENEKGSVGAPIVLSTQNILVFFGSGPITFVGTGPITFVSAGTQLVRQSVTGGIIGRYLGMTLTGTTVPWTLSFLAMQVKEGGDWT